MMEMLTQFLSSVQLFKQKILDVGTRIAGVEKYARKTTVASDGEKFVSSVVSDSQISLL